MLLGHLRWIGKTPRMSFEVQALPRPSLLGSLLGLLDATEFERTLVLAVTVAPVVVPASAEPHGVPAERDHDYHVALSVVCPRPEAPGVTDELHVALAPRSDVGQYARKPERHVDIGIVVVLRCISNALERRPICHFEKQRVCRRIRHFLNRTHKSTLSLVGMFPFVLR